MRTLHCILIALVLLRQFAHAEPSNNVENGDDFISTEEDDRIDPVDDLSAWTDDAKMENLHEQPMAEDGAVTLSEEEGEETEESEDSLEEQADDLTQWEPSLEEQSNLELEEHEKKLHTFDPIEEDPAEDMEDFDSDRQRRLEDLDSNWQGTSEEFVGSNGENEAAPAEEEDDEEALPIIPGLTDVELIAFNPEFANEEVLDKIIDWSYDQVAAMSIHRDNFIHVEDLYRFLLKTLNPLDEEIDAEDEAILTDAVTELRKQQGLVDDSMIVYRGFIARGMPLRFLQSLAHEMHNSVQRRLQSVAGRDEL